MVGAGSGVNSLISYGFGQQFRVANKSFAWMEFPTTTQGWIAPQLNDPSRISIVVLPVKIGNKHVNNAFVPSLRSVHEHRRTAAARIHGVRCRDRRRRAVGTRCGDPAEATQPRTFGGGGREGIGSWRPYFVGRRDGPGRARQARSGLARGCRLSAEDAGQG